ncbi:unnamed protein product [Zymoseptoria tritici ST99CH_1A5]|uniref:Uncharacterized protein n=1 Tax=Zymoseptoria tritici ST99CH_1A5 TaxID=1276529 RepID=A0A1Y6M3R6_ZYMTR|nr:unnamed protein product [Zymoseptoria tritici ST99CH_1A5]
MRIYDRFKGAVTEWPAAQEFVGVHGRTTLLKIQVMFPKEGEAHGFENDYETMAVLNTSAANVVEAHEDSHVGLTGDTDDDWSKEFTEEVNTVKRPKLTDDVFQPALEALLKEYKGKVLKKDAARELGAKIAAPAAVAKKPHIHDTNINTYKLHIFDEAVRPTVHCLPHQLTGALWILSHMGLDKLPLPDSTRNDPTLADSFNRIPMVSTMGGYVADDAGMGKTLLIALAMAIYAQWCEPEKGGVTGKKHIGYRPSLYLAPSAGVAEQAYQTIRKHFPDGALIPLLYSGDYPDAAEDAAMSIKKSSVPGRSRNTDTSKQP